MTITKRILYTMPPADAKALAELVKIKRLPVVQVIRQAIAAELERERLTQSLKKLDTKGN